MDYKHSSHPNRRPLIKGERFGKLKVIKLHHRGKGYSSYWLCLCDCGNKCVVQQGHLRSGHTLSCGCKRFESKNRRHGATSGGIKTREYVSWRAMKYRCLNPKSKLWKYYGARGIRVCPRWARSFELFFKDMGNRPKGLTLDRIDNNGDYTPKNCRWASRLQQSLNTRRSRFISHRGKTLTVAEWATKLGINYSTLYRRIEVLKWPLGKAVSTPVQ